MFEVIRKCLLISVSATRINDYEALYERDKYGEEMGPNARVFRVYLDEAEIYDKEMLEGWKAALDVLLVFVSIKCIILYSVIYSCH